MDDLMTGWSVDVLGAADDVPDSRDVRCLDAVELAKVIGVAATLSQAKTVVVRRMPDDGSLLPVISVDDPIETGREAALGQWEERWRQLRHYLADEVVMPVGRFYAERMDQIERDLPVGKPTRPTGGGS